MGRKRKVPAPTIPNTIPEVEESENGVSSIAGEDESENTVAVPNSTVDSSLSQNPMYSIMTNAQQNDLFHNKYIKEMQKLYEKMDHDSFVKSLTNMIKIAMQAEEKNEYAESTLVFVAKYAASYNTEDTHPVLLYLFHWTLTTISPNPHIRYRLCQFVNMLLNALGLEAALDDNICDEILSYMMNRLRDISPNVRLQAIVALQRLQCPENPNDPVVKAYQFHLSADPSSKVRQSVITSMGRNFNTIPFIIERLWDIDEKVRRHTYLHMSSYPVKAYQVIQRLTFLEQGLNDQSDAVKKVVINIMIPQWIESYKKDTLAFLSALKIDATECEIDRFRKVAKQLLPEIFKKEKEYDELTKVLAIDTESDFEFNRCIPFEHFSLELLIYWQSLVDFFIEQDANELEMILPEMTYMCSYIQSFYNCQKTEMDKFEKLEFNYKLVSLFEIILSMDFGDEFGKQQLMQIISELVNNFDLHEKMIQIIVLCSEKCIEEPDRRLEYFSNLIQNILDLDKNKDIIEDRALIERLLEDNNNKDLKIKLSSLKVKLLDLEEQETNFVDRKDYVRAQKTAEMKSVVTEEYRNLLKPILEQHNASTSFSNTFQQIKKLTNEGILKCLQLTYFVVLSKDVSNLIPSILNLFKDFVRRHAESPNIIIREWALKCGSAFGILYDQLAKDVYEVLVSQFYKNQSLRLWKVSIDCSFELLDRYGLEFFNDNTEGDKTLRRHGRTLYNATHSLSTFDQEEEESTGNGTNFLHMMLNCMTTCDDAVVVRALVIGFCRLVVHGVISNPDITENLLLRYFNPLSDIETNQLIGSFWESLIDNGGHEILQPCIINTIKTILNAPHDSPLLEIKPELILRFVIVSTRKLFNLEGLNVHNIMALSFLKEIENSFQNKELCKLLSKDLVALELDFENDTDLKREINILCDRLLSYDMDPKIIKSIEEFKNHIHGLMSATTLIEEQEQIEEDEPTIQPVQSEEKSSEVDQILSSQIPPSQEPSAQSTQNVDERLQLVCQTPTREEIVEEVTTPTTFGVENTTLKYLRKSLNNTKDRDTPTSNVDENEKSISNTKNKTVQETPKRTTRRNRRNEEKTPSKELEALNASDVIVATPSPCRDISLRRRVQAQRTASKKLPETAPQPDKTPENNRRSGSKRTLSMAQTPKPLSMSEKVSPLEKQQKTNETEKDTEFLRKSTEAVQQLEQLEGDEDDQEVSPLRKQRKTIESQDNVTTRRSKENSRKSGQAPEFLVSPDKISPLRKSAKAKENAENITPPRPTQPSPRESPKSTGTSPKRTPTKRSAVSPVTSSRNTRNAAKKLYQSNNIMTRNRLNESQESTSTAKALFPKKSTTTAKVSKIPVKKVTSSSTATSNNKQQTSLPATNSTSTLRTRIPTSVSAGTVNNSKTTVSRIALRKRKT